MLMQRKRSENTTAVIAPDAVVCEEATLEGDITIGSRCVIHPKAMLIAKDGPIILGAGNLIEEYAKIVNRNSSDVSESSPLVIGDNNVFEVYSEFEGKSIGSNNVLETKAAIGTCTTLTNGCVIGAGCRINAAEILPENTIFCGENYLRRTITSKPQNQSLQLDFLRKILPNYHYLVKTKKT